VLKKVRRRLLQGCRGPLVLLLEGKGDAFHLQKELGQLPNNLMENTETD
jgi:hypothetical protein